ncbi:MAG TPA: hypothetical protein VFQ62_05185 [Methylomirabilota bacterium]|nr:hypothetical protein [Methylomirabilota bacterium]
MAGGGAVKGTEVLVEAALSALPRMLDPRSGLFVFTVRPSGPSGQSLRYSCITLIGLTAAVRAGCRPRLDLDCLVHGISEHWRDACRVGDLGLLLWCLSDYHQKLTPTHEAVLKYVPTTADDLADLTSTELGWLVSGLSRTAQLAPMRSDVCDRAHTAYRALRANQMHATGLFCYGGRAGGPVLRRLRRQLGFFDNQVYGIHAGVDYHRAFEERDALAMAERCAEQIMTAQGPLGQWAWHYDVRTGAVIDRYPVYSVHQHGMGPMALRAIADATGRRFDTALERSVTWIFGSNELGETMIDADCGVIWRSIRRRVAHRKLTHVFKLLNLAHLQRVRERLARMVNTSGHLERDLECRPYELGWLLLALTRR